MAQVSGAQCGSMFCSPQLAARIDRAEGRLCAAIAEQATAPGSAVLVAAIGGGLAIFCGPDSPTNKMIGLGFDVPCAEADLAAIEAHFAAHGTRLQAEVATLADPALHQQLIARGYASSGFENVLGHPVTRDVAAAPAGIDVREVEGRDLDTLTDVMVEGFSSPDVGGVGGDELPPADAVRRWFATTMRASGFRGYLAFVDGAAAGGAALRFDDGIAQFSGAATLPAFRRRGVQTALLRVRLAEATRARCDAAVVLTQPASRSQQNVQREGFALLYSRHLLVKPA